MKFRISSGAACLALAVLLPAHAFAQSFILDPASASLGAVPATSTDVLMMAPPSVPGPGPLPAPVVGLTATALGLLPGDVVDAFSFGDDFGVPGIDTHYFSVDRACSRFDRSHAHSRRESGNALIASAAIGLETHAETPVHID